MPQVLAYCMTKAALNNFTVGLAAELGKRGITVNTLSPGLTATDMAARFLENPEVVAGFSTITALRRIGTVEDLADAASLIASDDARWVTGQYFEASGGLGLVWPGFGDH
jgi:NAD(P)-dependent dehydrogenase (short-subunit alcohol dehydrogenase family)